MADRGSPSQTYRIADAGPNQTYADHFPELSFHRRHVDPTFDV
jgi:hypothetical protein